MDYKIVISEKGVSFTERTVDVMRDWSRISRKKNHMVIFWSVAFDQNGKIMQGLGADYSAVPKAIYDKVSDVEFYWYADQTGIDAIKQYCIDVGWEEPSRLIELPRTNSNA